MTYIISDLNERSKKMKDTLEVIKNCQLQINELKKEDENFKDYLKNHYAASFNDDIPFEELIDLLEDDNFDMAFFNMRSEDVAEVLKWQTNAWLTENLQCTINNIKLIDVNQPEKAKENMENDIDDLMEYRNRLEVLLDAIKKSQSQVDELIETIDNLKSEA